MIAPSILACNFATLKDTLQNLEKYNIQLLHFDVMDNHFVPNLTFGPQFIKDIQAFTNISIDIHLMISNPFKNIPLYVIPGVKYISAHIEAFNNVQEIIETYTKLKEQGISFGLAIKPNTPISNVTEIIQYTDFILVMSVEPGFGGQSFIPETWNKITELSNFRKQNNLSFLIEVDGGINNQNMLTLKQNGVDIMVMGSAFFSHADPSLILQEYAQYEKY